MRIAIDNRLNSYRTGGIPQYTNQLIAALRNVAPHEQLVAIEHRKPPLSESAINAGVERRRVWTPPHHRWEQITLPVELRGLKADVIHFPDFIPLFNIRTPTVITVHDLAFRRFPNILDESARRYYGQIERAVQRADAIIAVSQSTRRDVVELLGVDESRIDVVYEAAAPHFQPLNLPPDSQQVINGYALHSDSFALFVGTVEPRKNLTTLLHALRLILDRQPAEPPRLIVAGARGWLDEPIFTLVEELRLGEAVRFIGGVSQAELVWLYNACRVYLHPELYSGFGLPILEAMQCGAPVIAADTSSLPEVVGDAGQLLPPRAVESWADAFQTVWHDSTARQRLIAAGFAQAARFSWTKAAHETAAIYRRVGQS